MEAKPRCEGGQIQRPVRQRREDAKLDRAEQRFGFPEPITDLQNMIWRYGSAIPDIVYRRIPTMGASHIGAGRPMAGPFGVIVSRLSHRRHQSILILASRTTLSHSADSALMWRAKSS